MSDLTFTLKTKYPCCGGLCRLIAIVEPDVRRERYDKRCPRCGQSWVIERRYAAPVRQKVAGQHGSFKTVGRIDVLDWERASVQR